MLWIIILSVIALIGFILLTIALIEPHRPEFTRVRLTENGGEPSLRILFFSDIHIEMCYVGSDYICGLIKQEKPDIVLFGGDVSSYPKHVENGIRYLAKISECCKVLNIPFIGVTGNHDIDLTEEQEKQCGFGNIENRYVTYGDYVLSGLDDSGRLERVWYTPVEVPADKKHILVVHDPDAISHIEDTKRIDYMLSGHIHGGQIRTPFRLEFYIRKDDLPRKGIFKGKHLIGNTVVYISRGLGCAKLPVRLGSRPEVSILEF
ncbi:MAG: metallophosphoesterase [Saccharofermentans sp.]|nr:metallophosphoesterase [Saccharofermentans sp.]